MTRQIVMLAAFLLLAAMPAHAQDSGYSAFLQRLSQDNRMQPLQNPEYTKGRDVLGWKILDRGNKVIGDVEDVIVSNRGGVTSLAADFNRLRLGQMVYLNYAETQIRPATNGYVLSYRDEQVENLYPSLLANIETASGIDDDNFSVQKLMGASVRSDDGRKLGKVEDVLFSGNGSRAAVLYVGMSYGTMRGKAVAVPFDLVRYETRNMGGMQVLLSDDQADALLDFIEGDGN